MRKYLLGFVYVAASVAICPKGYYEYRSECVADLKPITAAPVQPSDEKPPTDKMPSYQREGVHLIDARSMTSDDAKADQEKADADAEGKKAAGIK